MDTSTKIALVALALTAIGLMATHLRTRSSAELRTDVEVLKKQMALFWSVVERGFGNMLHSPHRQELDSLIERNQRGEKLEKKDVERFAELLQEIAENEEISHGEQAAAVLLKAAVLARHAYVNR